MELEMSCTMLPRFFIHTHAHARTHAHTHTHTHTHTRRWREHTRHLELWVEIMELNEQGEYEPVEMQTKADVLTGGIFMLRQVEDKCC